MWPEFNVIGKLQYLITFKEVGAFAIEEYLTLIPWIPIFYLHYDVTDIVKLLYRATSRRRVALWSLIMILSLFSCSWWKTYFIIYRTNAAQHDATCCNSSRCWLIWCFNLSRDIIWMLATYPPQLTTRYDFSENDVKIMFSVISGNWYL